MENDGGPVWALSSNFDMIFYILFTFSVSLVYYICSITFIEKNIF